MVSVSQTAEHAEPLAWARAEIDALIARLPAGGWKGAPAEAAAGIEELEAIVGHVPAAVRAFYERIDGIEIERGKPRDRFIVVALAEVLAAARAWSERYSPRTTARSLVPLFPWPVSPDAATKSGHSGGPPFGFKAPTTEENPQLELPDRPTFIAFAKRAGRLGRAVRST